VKRHDPVRWQLHVGGVKDRRGISPQALHRLPPILLLLRDTFTLKSDVGLEEVPTPVRLRLRDVLDARRGVVACPAWRDPLSAHAAPPARVSRYTVDGASRKVSAASRTVRKRSSCSRVLNGCIQFMQVCSTASRRGCDAYEGNTLAACQSARIVLT
jgi:hypothetical protein